MAETSNSNISKTTHRNIKIFSGMIFLVNIFHFMQKKLGVKKLANFPDYVPLSGLNDCIDSFCNKYGIHKSAFDEYVHKIKEKLNDQTSILNNTLKGNLRYKMICRYKLHFFV